MKALRGVLSVSKSELSKLLAEEKAASADKPKRGPKPKVGDYPHETPIVDSQAFWT